MPQASYEIVSRKGGWGVAHDGEIIGGHVTKEAAVAEASNAIKEGLGVTITVEASKVDQRALGKR